MRVHVQPGLRALNLPNPKEVLDCKILPQVAVASLGKPDENAGSIIYLCSDGGAASFMQRNFSERDCVGQPPIAIASEPLA